MSRKSLGIDFEQLCSYPHPWQFSESYPFCTAIENKGFANGFLFSNVLM